MGGARQRGRAFDLLLGLLLGLPFFGADEELAAGGPLLAGAGATTAGPLRLAGRSRLSAGAGR